MYCNDSNHILHIVIDTTKYYSRGWSTHANNKSKVADGHNFELKIEISKYLSSGLTDLHEILQNDTH